VGPLWILAEVSNPMHRLGIITGFIALFFVLVKVATRARIFDALAAAAAYSAVLMVFLQAIAI
jgi:preprotein translocase subunit SecD